MPDKSVERSDDQGHGPVPWWADLGVWGAVALIVLGALAALWVSFRLPGTPEEPATGYYGAARVIAIGLVIVGGGLLNRRRARSGAAGETSGAE
ncbi:hypothetical protein ACFYMX_04955 [Streptomyces griseofuscus]|uniref:hypothetical protein n=1 Tax=Streptomyces TaxID=1883 RepID=UPI00081ED201|nr:MULTISPECIES: hypothetical protein [unclassified Streptomyces]MBJ6998722.1 hypothetical protein [Streptomyces sp. CRPSP2-6A1]MYQ90312.1 hypothetical protein [Streptomyces sp. SID4946]SCF59532.1 hypothetical protein GA0115256_104032 [Streptomyces sp. DconLS]SCF99303.1 hypothetical protein GA0115258_123035 [Streptomyces sp. LamerLS-31b]